MAQRGRGATAATAADRSAAARPPARGGVDLAALRTRIRDVAEPVVRRCGYDLEDLSVSRAGRRHMVRVVVDGDDGVSLDAVADVSRELSQALDEAEESGGAFSADSYTLEVSSPGVDRPLTMPRHWRRSIGRLVTVSVAGVRVTGRVRRVAPSSVVLQVGDVDRKYAFDQLGPGRIEVEFTHLAEFPEADIDVDLDAETGDDDVAGDGDPAGDDNPADLAGDDGDGDDEEGKDGS